MQSWYQIKNLADGEYEVLIYDEIGFWGITAKQFIDDFRKIPGEAKVTLRINSPGGDVFDSLAIHNVIKRHAGEVRATVDGLAASGASIIAMAANHLAMPQNAFLMIHNSSGLAIGNADDMRDLADILEKIDNSLVSTYVAKTGQPPEAIAKMLSDETWLTAQEAKDGGFADEVIDAINIAALANHSRFRRPPQALVAPTKPESEPLPDPSPSPEPLVATPEQLRAEGEQRARDILAICTKAGVPQAAADFLDKGLSTEDVAKKLADADRIRARCLAAKLPERADAYIKAGMTANEVSAELFDVLLARQSQTPDIDNHLAPASERSLPQKNSFDSAAINARYRERESTFSRRKS